MSPWPAPAASTTAVADAVLERLNNTVAIATGLATTGRAVDLSGLQAAAGTLCARVLDLSPEDGLRFRPALMELDARLVVLEELVRRPAAQDRSQDHP